VHNTPLDSGGHKVWLQFQHPAEILDGKARLAQRQIDGAALEKRQIVVGIALCENDNG